VLQNAVPDSILAEASTYSSQYHCDAQAVEPTQLAVLAKSAFWLHLIENQAWLEQSNVLPQKGHWQALAVELSVSREALYRELAQRCAKARSL
jgi:hypothetical protein